MKALLTGGGGFVGSHVVDQLISRHLETYVLVSGFRSKKHPNIINPEAHIVQGDLRNYADLEKATKDMDYVFHLGAVLSHYCETMPELTIDVNVKGTWNLRKACVMNKVKRLVFASSSFVYGDPLKIPVDERHPTNPKDLLGITKLAGEKILQSVHPYKLPYTILRLFNVYGPRQYSDGTYTSVVSTWMDKALRKLALEIHADGTQSLDFVYVEDVAEAFADCLFETASNQVFNVASGRATSMNRLAETINKLAGNKAPSYYNKMHPAYLRYVQANIESIRWSLNWHPKTDLNVGLEKTMNWFKDEIT